MILKISKVRGGGGREYLFVPKDLFLRCTVRNTSVTPLERSPQTSIKAQAQIFVANGMQASKLRVVSKVTMDLSHPRLKVSQQMSPGVQVTRRDASICGQRRNLR